MSLDPPAYIIFLQNNVRARPISWDGAVRAKTISEVDLKKIRAIDKVRQEQRRQAIEGDLDGYVALLLGGTEGGGAEQQSIFQSAAKRPDIVQYMLVLVGDLVEGIPSFTSALVQHPRPYDPLLPLLHQSSNPQDPIPSLASTVLTPLLSAHLRASESHSNSVSADNGLDDALSKTFTYLASLAKSSDAGLQDIAVQSFSALLRTSRARRQFWEQRSEALSPLFEILKAAAGTNGASSGGSGSRDADSSSGGGGGTGAPTAGVGATRGILDAGGIAGGVGLQLLYNVLLVVWQLSFEAELVGEGLDDQYNLIHLYTTLIRSSSKEKAIRLLLSTLLNLLSSPDASPILLPAAALARLPQVLPSITQSRHFTDPDLLSDQEQLTNLLNDHAKTRTTFDEYAAEVASGHLRWTPPHRSPQFWRDNARRIIEDASPFLSSSSSTSSATKTTTTTTNGDSTSSASTPQKIPAKLAEIMAQDWSSDPQVLAIAANDVACLVRECPDKRGVMERAGLKTRCLELMASEVESVRWEALRAVGEWLRYNFD